VHGGTLQLLYRDSIAGGERAWKWWYLRSRFSGTGELSIYLSGGDGNERRQDGGEEGYSVSGRGGMGILHGCAFQSKLEDLI